MAFDAGFRFALHLAREFIDALLLAFHLGLRRRSRRGVKRAAIEVGARQFDGAEGERVGFALEVHPTEIAFDVASTRRTLEAIGHHPAFGFNFDPSHLGYQRVDYLGFLAEFGARVFNVHMKDVWWGHGTGDVGVFGGHTTFTDPRRYWDFRSLGHGDIKFEDIIEEVAGVYPRIMKDGDMDAGAWSCGMVAGLIHDIPTVKELIDRIMREAEEIITKRLAGALRG